MTIINQSKFSEKRQTDILDLIIFQSLLMRILASRLSIIARLYVIHEREAKFRIGILPLYSCDRPTVLLRSAQKRRLFIR